MNGVWSDSLGKTEELGKQLEKGFSNEVRNEKKAVKQQVGLEKVELENREKVDGKNPNDNQMQALTDPKKLSQEVKEFYYGRSDTPFGQVYTAEAKKDPDATPEELQKRAEERIRRFKEAYFNPTFNPAKKPEERPAEKVEKEEKQEMQELEQKKKKELPPPAIQRAQQKIEKFPGASG